MDMPMMQEWTNCSNKNEIKIRLMALSCAIFLVPAAVN
jgi:hypothetical protein